MSTYLLTAPPARGRVVPLLAVAEHLLSSGHRVLVLTGRRYADVVTATGAEFLPLPLDADTDAEIDGLGPHGSATGSGGRRGAAAARFDVLTRLVRPAAAQYAALRDVAASEPIDAIVTDPTFTGAALLWATPRERRPAVVSIGIGPLDVPSRDTAPFGLAIAPRVGRLGRLRDALLRVATESVLFRPIDREWDALALATIGRTLDGPILDGTSRADAVVQFTVPAFEYPRSDLPARIRFVGPGTRPPTGGDLPHWWTDLTRPGRVVLVRQGTAADADFDRLVVPTCAALVGEDVLVVVATDGRDPASLPSLPVGVRVAGELPADRLWPLVDVLVTPGDYADVQEALSYGVPVVVAGARGDTAEVAARVAWSGTGIDLRTDRPTPERVRSAVRRALSIRSFRDRAEAVGEDMRRAPGLAGLDEALAGVLADAAASPSRT